MPRLGVYEHAHTRAWSAEVAEFTTFTPAEGHDAVLQRMLTEVITLTDVLAPLRRA